MNVSSISASTLRDKGAPSYQTALVDKMPMGRLELTEDAITGHAQAFDWDWFADTFLITPQAKEVYARANWTVYLKFVQALDKIQERLDQNCPEGEVWGWAGHTNDAATESAVYSKGKARAFLKAMMHDIGVMV